MKLKIAALATVYFVLSSAVIYAPAEGASLEGFPKFNMFFDNSTDGMGIPNFPLKSFTDAIRNFGQDSNWDDYSLWQNNINVNMIVSDSVYEGDQKQFSVTPFSRVSKGQQITPVVYYVIGNAPITTTLYYNFQVLTPAGDVLYTSVPHIYNTQRNGTDLVGIESLKEIRFNQEGKYKIQLLLKMDKEDEFKKVGETLIISN
jgi:hypothetical protein